mmetsp:Transcript_12374/g.53113  ORF Transcript_12374/g.53113 Transcript_12374/m.53113 type:complete len:412 (+) Transcript_12374:613-1848(+)
MAQNTVARSIVGGSPFRDPPLSAFEQKAVGAIAVASRLDASAAANTAFAPSSASTYARSMERCAARRSAEREPRSVDVTTSPSLAESPSPSPPPRMPSAEASARFRRVSSSSFLQKRSLARHSRAAPAWPSPCAFAASTYRERADATSSAAAAEAASRKRARARAISRSASRTTPIALLSALYSSARSCRSRTLRSRVSRTASALSSNATRSAVARSASSDARDASSSAAASAAAASARLFSAAAASSRFFVSASTHSRSFVSRNRSASSRRARLCSERPATSVDACASVSRDARQRTSASSVGASSDSAARRRARAAAWSCARRDRSTPRRVAAASVDVGVTARTTWSAFFSTTIFFTSSSSALRVCRISSSRDERVGDGAFVESVDPSAPETVFSRPAPAPRELDADAS